MAELHSLELLQDANLQAYYRLEDVTDSKNSYDLTNVGTVAFNAAKYKNGGDCGETNNSKYLTVANNLGIDGGAISIASWVKCKTEIGTGLYIFLNQVSTTSKVKNEIWYDYNGGTRRLVFSREQVGLTPTQVAYTVTLGTSDWHHIAYTYDGTNIRGYVNGVLIAGPTAASGNGSTAVSSGFTIGARWDGSASYYASMIFDDTAVFNRALTLAETKSLYRSGSDKMFLVM